jgi:hypothetical protein
MVIIMMEKRHGMTKVFIRLKQPSVMPLVRYNTIIFSGLSAFKSLTLQN